MSAIGRSQCEDSPPETLLMTNLVTHVEVEWLKGVEDEVSHVFVHVGVHHTTIKIVNNTTTIHHLRTIQCPFIRKQSLN